MRMARKPSATARELLRNFPKGGKRRRKRKKTKNGSGNGAAKGRKAGGKAPIGDAVAEDAAIEVEENGSDGEVDLAGAEGDAVAAGQDE
jgi:hypothetical protein